jgi:hypothetical protein
MTITESKRTGHSDQGHQSFEKHKIFLYKEDFEKFIDGLQDAIDHIRQLQESGQYRSADAERRPYERDEASPEASQESSSSEVRFDDLG